VIPDDLWHEPYMRVEELRRGTGQLLVGTWSAATWAIDFYVRHGFVPVPSKRRSELLRKYWSISERQVETSVVLAPPPVQPAAQSTEPDTTGRV
jgi:hypothetical protein